MHGHGKFGLASLCNLDRLPPTGAVVIAAPLKIVGGSGSPIRAIALCSGLRATEGGKAPNASGPVSAESSEEAYVG